MKVIMLTWEFPPRIIGGIAPHVNDLSKALANLGIEVVVVTCDFPGAPDKEKIDGVEVHRVDSYSTPTPDFASWTYLMNMNLKRYAVEHLNMNGRVDLIHAHDWLVSEASIGLKHLFRIPLVATIHSTEYGRRNGIHSDYQQMIHETEVWLSKEAWHIICCSGYMASHINFALGLAKENITVIPNGVKIGKFKQPFDKTTFRSHYAATNEKIVLYVGRMVHEKGVDVLIEAIPDILRSIAAKFVLVGEGYLRDSLTRRVLEEGLSSKVFFTGFLDDATVKLLYRIADVCVVPSLFEPFGIVAIEAMAAGTPVVVSNVGGLSEIVQHGSNGLTVYPNDSHSLAWSITRILSDKIYAYKLAKHAMDKVTKVYDWDIIARKTLEVYNEILSEYKTGSWSPIKKP